MNLGIIQQITASQLRTDLPVIRPGCTVKVHVKIQEGEKVRIQIFEGVVVGIHGKGIAETITVRKMSSGIGVERIFPVNSPVLDKIEVVRYGKVRRAKLSYMRTRSGKANRIEEKR